MEALAARGWTNTLSLGRWACRRGLKVEGVRGYRVYTYIYIHVHIILIYIYIYGGAAMAVLAACGWTDTLSLGKWACSTKEGVEG